MDETKLHYTKSHEWLALDGDQATVGITRFAVETLNDITYLELPAVGAKLSAGKEFGTIESVKAAETLYSPVTGEVVEVNSAVADDPTSLAQDAYDNGWMIKIRVTAAVDTAGFMDKTAYDAHCEHH